MSGTRSHPGIHLLYLAAITIAVHPHIRSSGLDFTGWAATALFIGLLARRLSERRGRLGDRHTYALLSLPYIRYGYGGFPRTRRTRGVHQTPVWLARPACWPRQTGAYGAPWRPGAPSGQRAVLKPWALALWPSVVLGAKPDAKVAGAASGCWPRPCLGCWPFRWHCGCGCWSADALGEAWTAIVDYNRAYLVRGPGMLVSRTASFTTCGG
jgi:hypothetical protein